MCSSWCRNLRCRAAQQGFGLVGELGSEHGVDPTARVHHFMKEGGVT